MANKIVWSNLNLDIDDWRHDWYGDPDDDYALYEYMNEVNGLYLDDERMNLDIEVSQSIIAIADLGLWNGRHSGYQELNSRNIKDCLNGYSSCEYHEWYVDDKGDFRCTAVHHDGRNHILYRMYRDDATDEQIEAFLDKIYNGNATQEDVEAVTCRLGDKVAEVYGWEIGK